MIWISSRNMAGIRIQDFYNWMLRSGWTLGSKQLMRVLQTAICVYHSKIVRDARRALEGNAA